MKWVTRKRIQVNREATVWLVRRIIDLDCETRPHTRSSPERRPWREKARSG